MKATWMPDKWFIIKYASLGWLCALAVWYLM